MAFDLYAGSPKTKRERLELLKGSLLTIRSSFDAHWRDLADFVQPRRIRFFASDRNRGDKRNQNIIDSTARFAHRTLQSGLHAGLTSPARPWFKLTTPDPDLADFEPVKEWVRAGIAEPWRDAAHEADVLAYGEITQDLRAAPV